MSHFPSCQTLHYLRQILRGIQSPSLRITLQLAVTLACLLFTCDRSTADDGIDFFEKKIRPVLIQHCYECHSAASDEIQGDLRLDSRDAIRKGGDTGPAVVPNKAQQSLLLDAIRHETFEMPPDKKLSDAIIADFEHWVKMGAPDSRDQPPSANEAAELSWQAILKTRRDWWSMKPVAVPDVPHVSQTNWSDQPIDQFVLHKLDQAGLSPSKQAAPRTLIRRLNFTLLGIPPTPDEVDQFLIEYSNQPQQAYHDLIERLLRSPHFGERWARHWMDVVRFTETHGNEWNYEVHHAWRYRDYLIRAFNQDIPYDQLVREHIAGDLLNAPRWNEEQKINESVIGTAFYRFGEVNHDDCIGLTRIGYDLLDNRIDTLSKTFLATTVACARCHDHKIDAVSMKDYYAFAGILRSSRLVAHTIDLPTVNAQPIEKLTHLKTQIRTELAQSWQTQAKDINQYLLAANSAKRSLRDATELATGLDSKQLEKWVTALKVEKPPLEHPLSPWLMLDDDVAQSWQKVKEQYTSEQQTRNQFNKKQFVTYANFEKQDLGDWKSDGQGLRIGPTTNGEFSIAQDGNSAIGAILPAGCFTHTVSQKLNGRLQSPILTKGKKHLSFQVLGQKTSALRLVSNNCQLNYKNYRALTNDSLHWITFDPPTNTDQVRVYAELMTKLDNPKFPDQLGTLGKDTRNDRIPWKEAMADPRSYFGITRVVMHDCKETPKPGLDHLMPLFDGENSSKPKTFEEIATRYSLVIEQAINAWSQDQASETDVVWLNWLVKNNLLNNTVDQSSKLEALVNQYRMTENNELSIPRVTPGLADFDDGFDQPILTRGNETEPGNTTPRRFLEALSESTAAFSSHGSGRHELAQRIASPTNPLTARVMVNRVWHHLFGTGIVRTVDDFGHVGELPSHPELLDYLANRFIENGWSIKQLIRDIVRTKTFQMDSQAAPTPSGIDPQNRLLRYYPARRLDAEAIRDAILATSGRWDKTLFGLSIHPFREEANIDRRLFPGPLDGDGRRSVYIKANLMEGDKFLGAFNFPGGKVTQGRRDVTNVPTQALAMLNDPFVSQQAEYWSQQLLKSQHKSTKARIQDMFRQALGRSPTTAEENEFAQLVESLAKLYQVSPQETLSHQPTWKDVSHVVLNMKEFIYIP